MPHGCEIIDAMPWWRHQMEPFPRYWPFVRGIHRSPVNSPHKGQWRGALMFSLICTRINGWVNNDDAGDLRRHGVHYDVIVMPQYVARIIGNVCMRGIKVYFHKVVSTLDTRNTARFIEISWTISNNIKVGRNPASLRNFITVTSKWARWLSNHQPHNGLLNHLFRRRSKKTSKLCVTGLCAGNYTSDRWILRTNGQ